MKRLRQAEFESRLLRIVDTIEKVSMAGLFPVRSKDVAVWFKISTKSALRKLKRMEANGKIFRLQEWHDGRDWQKFSERQYVYGVIAMFLPSQMPSIILANRERESAS